MLFDFQTTSDDALIGDALTLDRPAAEWGVGTPSGRLTKVMLGAPDALAIVPCNGAAHLSLADGKATCTATARSQHAALVDVLAGAGVACHIVAPDSRFPDLCFTRDSTLMTPWGLLGLALAAPHRRGETRLVADAAAALRVPMLGAIGEGLIEGGDVAIVGPGTIAIGWSGARSDAAGVAALARLFEARGWTALTTRFDPVHLHLDCLFAMVDGRRALACREALEPAFLARIEALGIEMLPVTIGEAQRLGTNVLALGEGRVVACAGHDRIAAMLRRRGYRVAEVDLSQFGQCGGGVHCLTQPLARRG